MKKFYLKLLLIGAFIAPCGITEINAAQAAEIQQHGVKRKSLDIIVETHSKRRKLFNTSGYEETLLASLSIQAKLTAFLMMH
ncbi:MAG: hypothetical protein V4482_06790 [Pseudomonadota bacterium]